MGNRAVITTKYNFENNGVGIYLHWNGGPTSVQAFLTYCDMQHYRSPENDNYGWAYLATTIGNYFGDGLSLGIDLVKNLDCDNWDNGTYFIEKWQIVGRKFEHSDYSNPTLTEWDYIQEINAAQPEKIWFNEAELHKRYEEVKKGRAELPMF